jgi:hypothetical protein
LVLESLLIFRSLNASLFGFFCCCFSASSSWFADGKAWTNSGYLDLKALSRFRAWNENHESLKFRYTFTAFTGVGYFKVVYFANFDGLRWERPASATATATTAEAAAAWASSVRHLLLHTLLSSFFFSLSCRTHSSSEKDVKKHPASPIRKVSESS